MKTQLTTLELKVKICSLMKEAQIIRRLENKKRREIDILKIRQRLSKSGLSDKQIERITKRALRTMGKIVKTDDIKVQKVQDGVDTQKVVARLSKPIDANWLTSANEQWRTLREHRKLDLRSEARSAQLAYGFLRGRSYKEIEAKHRHKHDPDWTRIQEIATKFGRGCGANLDEKVKEWGGF
jgi:hypothetical protein